MTVVSFAGAVEVSQQSATPPSAQRPHRLKWGSRAEDDFRQLGFAKKLLVALGYAVRIRDEVLAEGARATPVYMFLCDSCGKLAEDYAHGFPKVNRRLYCFCGTCRETWH